MSLHVRFSSSLHFGVHCYVKIHTILFIQEPLMLKHYVTKLCAFLVLILSAVLALASCDAEELEFKVDFYVDDAIYESVSTKGEETLTLPANPQKTGYVFEGWYTDKDTLTSSFGTDSLLTVALTGNISVYAKWSPEEYTVTYNSNGGSIEEGNPLSYTIESGDIALQSPNRTGYIFDGWFTDENFSADKKLEKIPAASTGNIVLYAKWSAQTFSVTYNLDGGVLASENPTSYTIESDKITLANPTKNGYTFAGWTGAGITVPSLSVSIDTGSTGNKEYTANFTLEGYSIRYNLNGGTNHSANPSEYSVISDKIDLMPPTRPGYMFMGWYTDEEFTESSMLDFIPTGSTGDIALYANWSVQTYNITLNLNGGTISGNNPIFYTINSDTITLPTPEKNGYTFYGWYDSDSNYYSSVTIETGSYGNRVYTAYWTPDNYNIEYIYPEGAWNSEYNDETYTIESEIYFEDAFKYYYNFEGWYTSSDFSADTKIESIPAGSTGDITVYAKFTPTVYSITYNLDGGTLTDENPTAYTTESPDIILKAPKKKGYVFFYWQDETGTKLTGNKIAAGSHSDKSFTAYYRSCNHNDLLCGVCDECGATVHNPTGDCVCSVCGKEAHQINHNTCKCLNCGQSHFPDNNGLCTECGLQLPVISGNKVTFGKYPQSKVTDEGIIAALNETAGTLPTPRDSADWTAYNYKTQSVRTNYMWYIDIEVGGEKYRGVYFTEYRRVYCIDDNSFTGNRQNSNGYAKNTVYWFRYEPLTWTIIKQDGNKKLLLCDYIIDSQQWDYDGVSNISYAESTIRAWLNKEFLNVAFDQRQQLNLIYSNSVDNSAWSGENTSGGSDNTTDKVFLLSKREIDDANYGLLQSEDDRIKSLTDYAMSQGAYNRDTDKNIGDWWLRSPITSADSMARFVKHTGELSSDRIDYTYHGVVPAIWYSR